MRPPTTDDLLASIAAIHEETTVMLRNLAAINVQREEGREEARRRVLEMRAKLNEFFQWLNKAPLETPTM